jgi:hypothetical protein
VHCRFDTGKFTGVDAYPIDYSRRNAVLDFENGTLVWDETLFHLTYLGGTTFHAWTEKYKLLDGSIITFSEDENNQLVIVWVPP